MSLFRPDDPTHGSLAFNYRHGEQGVDVVENQAAFLRWQLLQQGFKGGGPGNPGNSFFDLIFEVSGLTGFDTTQPVMSMTLAGQLMPDPTSAAILLMIGVWTRSRRRSQPEQLGLRSR